MGHRLHRAGGGRLMPMFCTNMEPSLPSTYRSHSGIPRRSLLATKLAPILPSSLRLADTVWLPWPEGPRNVRPDGLKRSLCGCLG